MAKGSELFVQGKEIPTLESPLNHHAGYGAQSQLLPHICFEDSFTAPEDGVKCV